MTASPIPGAQALDLETRADRDGLVPARIVAEHRQRYRAAFAGGEVDAELAGRLRHAAAAAEDLPAVGDHVVLQPPSSGGPAIIRSVLPRRSVLVRGRVGAHDEAQVIAANIDLVFVVDALDPGANLRRIERYLALVRAGGATPVIVLNKADRCRDLDRAVSAVTAIAGGADVVALSAIDPDCAGALAGYLGPGTTIGVLGPSGVGKSTLSNALMGAAAQATGGVNRMTGRGRHTTTARQLLPLPGGAFLIDTPGMRELQLRDASEGVDDSFPEITERAAGCRFRDCTHGTEPGCAVQAAIASGALREDRLRSFQKLSREVASRAQRARATGRR